MADDTSNKRFGRNKGWSNLMPPVKPGEVRNPKGRPKGSKDGFRAHLNRLLRKGYEPNAATEAAALANGVMYRAIDTKCTNVEVLAQISIQRALMGDTKALRDIADRVDGRPSRAVEFSVAGGGPTEIMAPEDVEAKMNELRAAGWRLPGDP